jgi:transposase
VKFHAAGALHQRLDNDGSDGVGASGEQLVERRRLCVILRQIHDVMLRQQIGEQRVHAAFGVAHRHGAGGVAVIAALEGDELPASLHAAVDPVLRRHFERDFDSDRTGIGKEHAAEIARQHCGQPPRQC